MNFVEENMPRLVAERLARFSPLASVIRSFRTTAAAGKPNETDSILANPPFNNSDTALRACAFSQSEATMQVVSEAKDNFRKDDDVRWRWSGASWATEDCRQGERGGVHHSEARPGAAAIRSK